MSLDAIILAGGKSERLRGLVPAYHKPFLVINGKSLLVSAVDLAQRAGAERIIVVATGENAMPVWQLIGHLSRVRVALNAGGPAEAVHTGLEWCTNDRVLTLMSDNIHVEDEVLQMCMSDEYAIGVQQLPAEEAQRFTRLRGGLWIEGPASYVEGELTTVWCGPLIIDRRASLKALLGQPKIGPHLAQLFPSHQDAPQVTYRPVSSRDIGIPDVVTELTSQEH